MGRYANIVCTPGSLQQAPFLPAMSSQESPLEPPLKLYSLQEANALLPRIADVVARLQEIFGLFRKHAEEEAYPASLQRSKGH